MPQDDIQFFEKTDGGRIAYVYSPAKDAGLDLPTVIFCGGYKSDMNG